VKVEGNILLGEKIKIPIIFHRLVVVERRKERRMDMWDPQKLFPPTIGRKAPVSKKIDQCSIYTLI
jgi:hypothetical protein